MDPTQLHAWEVILRSPVAVSLLLLGAVLTLGTVHLAWVRGVLRENRELHGWIREHLEAEAGVARVLADLRPLLDLIHGEADPSRSTGVDAAPLGVPGMAGPAAPPAAPDDGAPAGDPRPSAVSGGGA